MIRIVGLSATLPNYKDVASFLGVTDSGLFYFDASYRPVPLAMQFIGATDKNIMASKNVMDEVCFQKVGLFPCCIGEFDARPFLVMTTAKVVFGGQDRGSLLYMKCKTEHASMSGLH